MNSLLQRVALLPTLRPGDKGRNVGTWQEALKKTGYFHGSIGENFKELTTKATLDFQSDHSLVKDSIVGPKTRAKMVEALEKLESTGAPKPIGARPATPWYKAMLSWTGKGEKDKSFVAYMSGFWGKVGLPGYKTIVGSRFAWCGLGVAAALIVSDMNWAKDGAGAKNWAKFGTAIEWKTDGIPQGAIIHVNPKSCSSGSGNHVSLADGDCAPADLLKSGATINLRGANQANQVKVSTYRASTICAVRWPKEVPMPPKITKSVNCSGSGSTSESTR